VAQAGAAALLPYLKCISGDYIKAEGKAGRMGARLMAIIAEGDGGRVYLPPTEAMEVIALQEKPQWKPDLTISGSTQYIGVKLYGLDEFSQLFTDRQLIALTTFSDLIQDALEQVKNDSLAAGQFDEGKTFIVGNAAGALAYGYGVVLYLALCLSKSADYWSNLCIWRSDPKNLGIGHVFARQAIPMTWDYAEGNPFSSSSGSWLVTIDWIVRFLFSCGAAFRVGHAIQLDACHSNLSIGKVVSTPAY
jgi:putative DNA methylase